MKIKPPYIFFFTLLTVWIYGQVNILVGADKRILNSKERFVLTVVQEINGNNYIQETPLRTPDLSRFNKLGEASVRHTFVDPSTKTLVNQLVYEFFLEPKQTGRIKIGSFLLTVNGVIYKSEPFDILVKESEPIAKTTAEVATEPVQLYFELENQDIYPNQPVQAVLRAYSKDFNNLRRMGKISFASRDFVEVQPLNFEKSEIEQDAHTRLASQVLATVTILPNKSGKITVPVASVTYKNADHKMERIESNVLKINVKKLPENAPAHFKGLIGSYDFKMIGHSSNTTCQIHRPQTIKLKIKGEGNWSKDKLPKLLEHEAYKAYPPKIKENLQPSLKGSQGEIVVEYIVVPRKQGLLEISTEDFAYFNPETKTYHNLGKQSFQFHVMTPEQISHAKTTIEKVNDYTNDVLETVSTPIVPVQQYKLKDESQIYWHTVLINYFLIGSFIAFLVVLWYKMKKKKTFAPSEATFGTVREKEMELREVLGVGLDSFLEHVEKQWENCNCSTFFTAFEDLNAEAESFVKKKYGESLKQYFLRTKGEAITEEHERLLKQMQMEKYAPCHEVEELKVLMQKIKNFYSDIV